MPSTSAIGKLVEAADVHGGDHQASNRSVIGPDEHGRVYHQNAFGYGGHKQDERACGGGGGESAVTEWRARG